MIIDDEPLAREGIKNYIKRFDFIELVASLSGPVKALKILTSQKIDLMFLDIQMPELNGLDFLKNINKPSAVIITTAYPDYALNGFELDVLDYLVKPISFDKFLKSVNKARDYIEIKAKAENINPKYEDFFFIKTNNKYDKISYDNILFIEAMQNYIVIHTPQGKHIAYTTLKNTYDNLPKDCFIRVQKSFIVSISKIDSIIGNNIKIGEHLISISRENKSTVLKKILNNKLFKR